MNGYVVVVEGVRGSGGSLGHALVLVCFWNVDYGPFRFVCRRGLTHFWLWLM